MRKHLWIWVGGLAVLLLGAAILLAVIGFSGPGGEPLGLEAFLASPPVYEGAPGCVVNGNRPFFTREELQAAAGIRLSELDGLGRCGPALALLGPETQATEKRGPIGEVRPSGWHTVRYDDRIEDRYLYNRCHLLAYQLTGDNADPRNLITGTRYMNVEGMLPVEILVGNYIEQSGKHVVYRVTPVFQGRELLARGVLMEARSLEDGGKGLQLCRYVFNVQPGVLIDYADGGSRADPDWTVPEEEARTESAGEAVYVLNSRTMRFHRPDCPAAEEIAESNRILFQGSLQEALEMGYRPCGVCEP